MPDIPLKIDSKLAVVIDKPAETYEIIFRHGEGEEEIMIAMSGSLEHLEYAKWLVDSAARLHNINYSFIEYDVTEN